MLKQAYSNISRIQPCHQHTLRQEGGCTRITASTLATTWFFMSSSTTLWKSAGCYIRAEILSRLSGRFLSAKERRRFDSSRLTLPSVVDAKRTCKPHRDRKVPGIARAPAATYELYREFRTNRRPLNVASVVSRTVRAGKFICGRWRPGDAGDRTSTTTASCLDRRRRRTARFLLGRIYGGQPPRSWRRCRCMPREAAPSRGCPGARAS